jgi:hypothetical protein
MAVPEDPQVNFLFPLVFLSFPLTPELTPSSSVCSPSSLSTMHREFAGLKGMPYYDQMLNAVLQAHSSPLVEPASTSVSKAMEAYSVNEPQARAILGAMSPNTSGFVLIQGSVFPLVLSLRPSTLPLSLLGHSYVACLFPLFAQSSWYGKDQHDLRSRRQIHLRSTRSRNEDPGRSRSIPSDRRRHAQAQDPHLRSVERRHRRGHQTSQGGHPILERQDR